VLSARAGQAEADLDFGIVDQLLRTAGAASPAAALSGANGSSTSSFSVGARLLEVVGDLGAVAIVIDDLQWADRKSVEALTFMLRRLSVDPVAAVVTYRRPGHRLDEAAQRMLLSVENRLHVQLSGLHPDEVASLAAALTAGPLDDEAVQRLYQGTGGHPLYLSTLLSEGFRFDPRTPGRLALPRSLAAAIGEHLRVLPPTTRAALEMLSVLNLRLPIAQVHQAPGDYLGMADALGPWLDGSVLDGRSRVYAVLWRPLLVEGLVGSGQVDQAAVALDQLRGDSGQVGYLQPALAWLEGWLAEQQGDLEEARRIYADGEASASTGSPVYAGRLLLAHGRLLRRTGNRKEAVERLRRANSLFGGLRAAPFVARVEAELAACHLPGNPVKKQSALALTSRETEVAHLVGRRLSNPEIAGELYISRKAVEYHLSNIYAKCGLSGRQALRRYVEQWRQPTAV
jgi:DNA-binding CsgD family transcriptional regulator